MGHRFEELKHRIEAKKKELQSKLETYKADKHGEAADESTKIKTKLDELELHVKTGWDNLTDSAAAKLNEWLK
jgi:hypothetical protein